MAEPEARVGLRLSAIFIVLLFLFGVACGTAGSNESLTAGPLTESRETVALDVTIGPELVDCVGLGPRKCLVVDDGFFYERIEGFDHEPGYRYRILMEQYDRWPGREEPPQDASRYGYRLIEILEKVQEP